MSAHPSRRRTIVVRTILALGVLLAGGAWLWRGSLPGLEFVRQVPPTQWRMCRCRADTVLVYNRPDDVAVSARVYRPAGASTRGGILLFHGNTIRGGEVGLFRVLGRKLADAGYLVLAPDLAGFGRSGDPFQAGSVAALRMRNDTRAAVAALVEIDSELSPIFAIGHSATGVPALELALVEDRVAGGVAIGPERKGPVRAGDRAVQHYFWERMAGRYQELYDRDIPAWFTEHDFRRMSARNTLDSLGPLLEIPGHSPIMIVSGARENAADIAFADSFLQDFGPDTDIRHLVVPHANHYMNVVGTCVAGGCVYDDRTMSVLLDAVGEWMEACAGTGSNGGARADSSRGSDS